MRLRHPVFAAVSLAYAGGVLAYACADTRPVAARVEASACAAPSLPLNAKPHTEARTCPTR